MVAALKAGVKMEMERPSSPIAEHCGEGSSLVFHPVNAFCSPSADPGLPMRFWKGNADIIGVSMLKPPFSSLIEATGGGMETVECFTLTIPGLTRSKIG
jgi:hypothetical protein